MTTMTVGESSGDERVGPRTYDVFKVLEREGERPEWRKVGDGIAQVGGGFIVVLEGLHESRALLAVAVDRIARPVPAEKDARRFPTHELFARDGDGGRKRVGVVFVNRDGSFTLLIDEGEREGPRARLQMRIARAQR